jgi:D-alanyl-D-alanine carboxypeptidase
MNKLILATLTWMLLGSVAARAGVDEQCTTRALSDSLTDEARIYLESRYPDGRTPGVSVLVACEGQTIFSYNSGMANIEWQQPISSNTSFRVGSISKPLTTVAILQLVEQGKIDLDNPISKYVPLLPNYMRAVTVRQLMSHTSGLPDILLTPLLLPLARDWVSKSQVIGMQAHTPTRSAPGEKFEYSNFNYILLAALIEHITDTKYGDYMDNAVFEPLDMTRSHYDARRTILTERAKGYDLTPFGQLLNAENIDMSHASAAGALLSSANDLRTWAHLLMSGKLLKPEMLELAWSPQTVQSADPSSYGLGFNTTIENGRRVIWHTGMTSGFQSAISMYPENGLTVIVLGNGLHLPGTGKAADSIAEIVLAKK